MPENDHKRSATYDFLVVDFQATDDEIHGLLNLSVLLLVFQVGCMVLVSGALKVESVLAVIHDFEHRHVLGVASRAAYLLLETLVAIVVDEGELVARAHDHGFVGSLQRFLG